MRRMILVVVFVGGACSDKKPSEPPPPPPSTPTRFEGPMPITFGDCGILNERFVSGPRPIPLTRSSGLDDSIAPVTPPVTDPAKPIEPTQGANTTAPPPPPPKQTDSETAPNAIDLARNAGHLGPVAGTDAFEPPPDILGQPTQDDFGVGKRGEGQQNTGPTYGGGIGRIGVVGHGSGYGTRSPSPLTLGRHTVKQEKHLHPAIVRRYINRQATKLSYCYERRQLVTPKLEGTVNASFVIGADGFVSASSAKGIDDEVASCIAGVIKTVQFPKPNAGAIVQVEFPLVFKPIAGAAQRVAAEEERRKPAPPSLFAKVVTGDHDYRPGAQNPLRGEGKAIEDCLRVGTVHAGVLVVELGYDAGGKVTASTIHGTADEGVKRCLGAVAARATRVSTLDGERCSIAFGHAPLAQTPALEITATAVLLDGKTITETKTIEQTVNQPVVPALVSVVADRVAAALQGDAPVVTVHGPLVIKPLDTTTMRVVKRVVASVLAGGDDFVLAAKGAGDWELVSPLALPVVPVPRGTGGVWNRLRVDPGFGFGTMNDDTPTMIVMKDKVEVGGGASAVTVFVTDLQTKLPEALKAYAGKRTEIRIIVRDDVTYASFLATVKIVVAAGLTDWELVAL